MRSIKKWIGALAVMLLMFALAACGPGGGGQEPAAAEGERVLTIGVFEGGFGRDFWYDMIERFEAANPGVTVDMTISPDIEMLLAPRIAVGDIPDFLSVNMDEGIFIAMRRDGEFRNLDNFFNNTEVLDRPGTLIRDIIIPGMLDNPRFAPDGNIILAPFNAGPMGMVYNQDLFERMGWDLPETWDDLFAMDALLDDPATFVNIGGNMERRAIFTYQGIHPGYLESILWPAIASVVGLDGLDRIVNYEEGAWDNPQVRQVVENLARLGVEGYLMEGTVAMDHTTSQAMMMMGRALFIPNGLWFPGEMADAPREDGFRFAIAPPPTLTAGQTRFIMSSSEQIALPIGGNEPELAEEFLRFMYTRESIARFAQLAGGNVAIIDAPDIIAPYIDAEVANMLRAYELGSFMLFGWAAVPEGFPIRPGAEVFADNMSPLMTGAMSVDDYIMRQEEVAAMIREFN
jgi:N-acetylglucosamine transport system substrate-binding protein